MVGYFFLYCYIASVSSLFGENGQKSHTKSILPPVCGGTIYKLIVPYYTNFIHSSANKLSAQHNNNNSNSNSSSINSTTVQLNSQHIHTSKQRAESIHGQSALNRIGILERNEQEKPYVHRYVYALWRCFCCCCWWSPCICVALLFFSSFQRTSTTYKLSMWENTERSLRHQLTFY